MEKSSKNLNWKEKLHEIIYEADTKEGKLFDVVLLFAISHGQFLLLNFTITVRTFIYFAIMKEITILK